MREHTIHIDSLAFGGAGFGRLDGKACFVPGTAPDDVALVRVRKETSSYLTAELVRLVDPSPQRISPPCPIFGRCGGCQWQHLIYEHQCAAKEQIFAEALWRLARVERNRVQPLVRSAAPWGYRSRIQLKVYGRGVPLQMGFYAQGSHYVIDLPGGCAVVHSALNDAATAIRGVLQEYPRRDLIPQIDLAQGNDGAVVMTIHYLGKDADSAADYWRTRGERLGPVTGICLQTGRKSTMTDVWGDTRLFYMVPTTAGEGEDLALSFSAGSFSQVHYRMNAELIRTVLQWAALTGKERVLDLCCGNGNFSLPLATHAAEVVGLETGESSVADARSNADRCGIDRTVFHLQEGSAGLSRFLSQGERFDLVVLDPPRSGAPEMAALIPQLGPRTVIYVSCDPQTLGRDLARLQKGGYRVVQSRPFDMFPQTYHLESVTLLQRD